MKLGYVLQGIAGFLLAGLGFVLPGLSILLLAALYYKELGQLAVLVPFLYGLKPAVLAILSYTVIRLAFRYLTRFSFLAGFIIMLGGYFTGYDIIFLLILAIGVSFFLEMGLQRTKVRKNFFAPLLQVGTLTVAVPAAPLLSIFIKTGIFLAGSGFVILAFAKTELVDKGWMTIHALLDSVAIALFVPGPITGLAGFIGYQVGEINGALLAVAGLLIPTAIFAMIGLLLQNIILENRTLKIIARSWHVSTLGFLAACVIEISYDVLNDYKLWIIGVVCLSLMIRFPRMHKVWVLIIGANLGYIMHHYLL